jgi:sugar phosphate isomerase/epimerase
VTRPFRLGVPSWVIPGTYLENLRFLTAAREISAVELLFFLYNGEIKKLFREELPGIRELSDRFVFTAHLPEILKPEYEELVETLSPLVRHFIVHPGPPESADVQAGLINAWAERYAQRGEPGETAPARFLAENTNPGHLEALLPHLSGAAGLCMDTGHLLMEGRSPAVFFTAHRDRIAEIHLHGLDREKAALDGRLPDHRPVRPDAPWFTGLLPLLGEWAGIINLEVFSWEEAAESLRAVGVGH